MSNSLFPLDHALVALLRKHGKDAQADDAIRGELLVLNLWNRPIGDDGAVTVAAFLMDDEIVLHVDLLDCTIGPRGGRAIAEALKRNKTVEVLELEVYQLVDESALALIDALNYNTRLKVLNVWANSITLQSNATIRYLTETRNKVLIPAAVRSATLCIIAARRTIANAGYFADFPKEIVKMIAMQVWATRKDPIWIRAVSSVEQMARQKDYIDKFVHGRSM